MQRSQNYKLKENTKLKDLLLIDSQSPVTVTIEGNIVKLLGIKASEVLRNRPDIFDELSRCLDYTNFKQEILYKLKTGNNNQFLTGSERYAKPQLVKIHREDVSEINHKEREETYRHLVDFFPEAIAIYSEGKFVYINQVAVQLFGANSQEEILGKSFLDIFNQDGLKIPNLENNLNLEIGRITDILEQKLFRLDRKVIEVEIKGITVIYQDKPALQLIIRDISDRNRAELARQEGEERYRAVVTQTSNGIYLVDVDSKRILEANPAICKLLGYTEAEILELTLYDIMLESQEIINSNIQHLLTEKNLFFGKFKNICQNGSLVDVETSFNLISYGGKEVICAVLRDITERVQAETALRQSEERYRQIIETASEGIGIVNAENKTVFANEKMAKMLGYSLSEMIGKDMFSLISEEDKGCRLTKIQSFVEGTNQSHDCKLRRKDGSDLWVMVSANSIVDEEGKYAGSLGMFTNITKRKLSEEALRKSEATNRALLNAIPDLMIRMSGDGTYLDFIPPKNFKVIMPYQDMRGKNLFEVMSPEFAQKRLYYMQQALATGVPQIYEYEILIDGNISYQESRIVVSGENEVLVMVRDISDRKRSQQKFERLLSLLRGTLEATADGIMVSQNDGNLATFNQNFLDMWKMPEFIVLSGDLSVVLEFILTQIKYPEKFIDKYNLLCQQSDLETFNIIELKDGRTFEHYSKIQQLGRDKRGRVCSFRDITEQKRAEEELRKSEERFDLLAKATNDAVWDWDLITDKAWCNQGFQTLFGYNLNQIDFKFEFWAENIYPEERSRVIANFSAILSSNAQLWSDEYRFRRSDGSYSFVLERGYIIRNESGQAVRVLGTMMDISDRKKAEEIIRYQANYDLLTSLPNRILFNEQLLLSLKNAREQQTKLAVMFLDLDRFKFINDTLGHAIGDQLLQIVAKRISSCLRERDTVARWGGDEFTLLLPHLQSPEDAGKIAQRILNALKPVITIEGHPLHITSSIGIAIYPGDGKETETLLRNADAALYLAKEKGRNNYQFYTPAINSQASELLVLENELHHALKRNEFVLYYQPQINISTGKVIGMEALVRWQHPKFGLVSPAKFIPLAEETGLILPIGEWVLRTACNQCKIWQDAGLSNLTIAINLSGRQFQQPNLLQMVEHILLETGLSSQYLELEITESVTMQDVEKTRSILNDLHQMGVHLSIDDFGTGYSSLNYLKKFPINTLKIDKSFVDELTHTSKDIGIIHAIMMLGKGLNIRVIAEGVETEIQKNCLQNLQCEVMQGYWFSKPLVVEDATNFLLNYFSELEPTSLVA